MSTTEIINEFVSLVDTDKAYNLKELKDILSEVYKTKSTKKSTKKATKTEAIDSGTDDEPPKQPKKKAAKKDDDKPKKPPSAYNNFIKSRIEQLKVERTDIAPRDLMKVAASDWKQLDKQQQESYKM